MTLITTQAAPYVREAETVLDLARHFLDAWDRTRAEYSRLCQMTEREMAAARLRPRFDEVADLLHAYECRCPDMLRMLVADCEAVRR